MTDSNTIIELGRVIHVREEPPPLEAILAGEVPIVAKVRFGDGSIELRGTTDSRTDLIFIRRGDLLVSGINALKGAIGYHPKDAPSDLAATIHYSAYEINEERVLPRYLHEYLRSPAFQRRAVSQLPSGIKTELKAKRLLSIAVPLPAKPEQHDRLRTLDQRRQIMANLIIRRRQDAKMVLGRRVSVAVDARQLLVARLQEMQAHVSARCSMGTLEEALVEGLRHGPSFPCAADADGVPVLMPSSTTGFGLDTSKVMFAIGSPSLRALDFLESGDIIFARGNKPDQVGNCGLYEGDPEAMTYANLFMRIRVDSGSVSPWFTQYWLMTPLVHEHVLKHTKGTGPSIQKINGLGVRSIPFPRALPAGIQRWWVDHLHEARLLIARVEELMGKQAEDLVALQRKAVEEVFSDL